MDNLRGVFGAEIGVGDLHSERAARMGKVFAHDPGNAEEITFQKRRARISVVKRRIG